MTTSTLAVGGHVGDGVAAACAVDGRAERGLRGVDGQALRLDLAGAEQERLDLVVVVADELVGDDHAGLDDAVVGRGLADLRAAEHVLELADPGLLLALLVLGGVVAAVLLEVALVARGADLLDDLLARGPLRSASSAWSLSKASWVSQIVTVLGGLRHEVLLGSMGYGGATPPGAGPNDVRARAGHDARALRENSPGPSWTALRDSQNEEFNNSVAIAQVSGGAARRGRCSRPARPTWPGARCGRRRSAAAARRTPG